MLRLLRNTRAFALFALLVIGGSVPVSVSALLHADDDAACAPSVVVHDHNAHRIGAEPSSGADTAQHCVVCHWLQSLQTTVTSTVAAVGATGSHQLIASTPDAIDPAALASLAARAPPASL